MVKILFLPLYALTNLSENEVLVNKINSVLQYSLHIKIYAT